MPLRTALLTALLLTLAVAVGAAGEIEKFMPRQGGETELWRVSNDPGWRDWAYYHSRNCWSADGRYIVYSRLRQYLSGAAAEPKIRVYDFLKDRTIEFDRADDARWAHHHNWLFFPQLDPDAPETSADWKLKWWDADSGRLTPLAKGHTVGRLGDTDCGDRWVFANRATRLRDGGSLGAARVPIRGGGPPTPTGFRGRLAGNPFHPRFYSRIGNADDPLRPTRLFYDIDTGAVSMASPVQQQCHQSWSGDGAYYLFGNSQMRGRKWNESFPSNIHFLSAIGCGDICRCGKSGRWLIGSSSYGSLPVADLRSGDGHIFLKYALSNIHDNAAYSKYSYGSFNHDNDAKGSPDGTKVSFVTNYDLKDGPLAIVEGLDLKRKRLVVNSTEGFPAKGRLTARDEIVGYDRKTPKSFEGLKRNLYGTGGKRLRCPRGMVITSFDARLIPEAQRAAVKLPRLMTHPKFADKDSPLRWQRRTDLYVAVIRKPDRPFPRKRGRTVELVPGENHWETFGYHVLRDGKRITNAPVRPGATFALPGAGQYAAVAVEFAGLESEPSAALSLPAGAKLRILREKPKDFTWTSDRWIVNGKPAAVREIVHRYDGVIHREWYERGVIAKRHDLNAEGKPIRRLFYTDGRLARREYHSRTGFHLSTEHFDSDGYITEMLKWRERWGPKTIGQRWWYIKGTPVKAEGRGVTRLAQPQGRGTYVKTGDQWVRVTPAK